MKTKKRPCKSCQTLFTPDKYNHQKQEYCCKPECRKVAAREKRAKYRQKKKWDLEFRADEVKRVQKWRLKNPGYSQKKPETGEIKPPSLDNKDSTLDFTLNSQKIDDLRDLVIRQELIIVGIASQLVGAIPENVESFILNCCNTGRHFAHFSDSVNNRFSSSKILLDGKSDKNMEKISS